MASCVKKRDSKAGTIRPTNDTERSLLLFLEGMAVDHEGLVDPAVLRMEDVPILEKWIECGFIQYGDACYEASSILVTKGSTRHCFNWVQLSPRAWQAAQHERRARARRMWNRRTWRTAGEISKSCIGPGT